ncbi:PilN domain-containing protein [Pleionea litopenaei]|uniref:PilN domain-containing protein n=1 Tax=Pleionea litopenaei TaxID=3070815 RepID=A0AA51RR07_9GAMM|nr:PilN domain-containing protein [Pleionea sp. HL-JVS1]WMS85952.1 PilN domain-containing protein [Pleionea sp. HL-JVS1]
MQQVNLYLDEFKPRKESLTFEQFIIASVSLLLLYSALGWMMASDTQLLKDQVRQERAMLEPMKAQLKEIESLMASRPDQARIDQQISQLEYDIQNKTMALQTFQSSDISASDGFSRLFVDLAKNNQREIWLTHISIEKDTLTLSGQTIKPELISDWITVMAKHATLNREYQSVEIKQNEINQRVYDFQLSGGVIVHHE